MFITEARNAAKAGEAVSTRVILGSDLTLVSSYYDVTTGGESVATRWFIPGASGTIEVVTADSPTSTTTTVLTVAAGVRYPVAITRIKSGAGTTVPVNATLMLGL